MPKKCLNCGHLNESSALRCGHCEMPGRFREIAEDLPESKPTKQPETGHVCRNCGHAIGVFDHQCANCEMPVAVKVTEVRAFQNGKANLTMNYE